MSKSALLATVSVLVAAAPAAADPRPVVVDARFGPALMMRSRSNALPHLLAPEARLGARIVWSPRLELGADLLAVLGRSEHYRVLGALARARGAVWWAELFSVGLAAAVGIGHDADILHDDLSGGGGARPYALVAADARWNLGERWLLGVEASWENLSVASLGLALGRRFGGAS